MWEKGERLWVLSIHTHLPYPHTSSPHTSSPHTSSPHIPPSTLNHPTPITTQGHTADVLDVCWSKKGLFLLSASMDHTVRLWHISLDTCLSVFTHNDYVTSLDFHPINEHFILSGSMDGKVVYGWWCGVVVCGLVVVGWWVVVVVGTYTHTYIYILQHKPIYTPTHLYTHLLTHLHTHRCAYGTYQATKWQITVMCMT